MKQQDIWKLESTIRQVIADTSKFYGYGMIFKAIGFLEVFHSKLDDREQRILKRRFGLDGSGMKTYEEVGNESGITRERVRQIEQKAFRKLKSYYEKQ